jgi:leucyl-tRNA synthetase
MTEPYVPQDIEKKWREKWEKDQLYRSVVDWSKPKHYALTMLPYPSGDLHIGHHYAMAPSDVRARYMRMQGYNVLMPMGFDAFGLPAENAAIQRGIHPHTWTLSNVENMRRQLKTMGAMFDWEREAISCLPGYYRWSEWFFLKLYDMGLAYRKTGDGAAAARQFEQVIELFPTSVYGQAAERALQQRRERGLPGKED